MPQVRNQFYPPVMNLQESRPLSHSNPPAFHLSGRGVF